MMGGASCGQVVIGAFARTTSGVIWQGIHHVSLLADFASTYCPWDVSHVHTVRSHKCDERDRCPLMSAISALRRWANHAQPLAFGIRGLSLTAASPEQPSTSRPSSGAVSGAVIAGWLLKNIKEHPRGENRVCHLCQSPCIMVSHFMRPRGHSGTRQLQWT